MDESQATRIALDDDLDFEPEDEGVLDQPDPTYDQPVAYVSLGLTIGDGFKFGCGLAMALVIAGLATAAILSVAFLAASLMGVPVPIAQ